MRRFARTATVLMLCLSLAPTARAAARRKAPAARPKLITPREPLFPAQVSEELVRQLVGVARVAPKPNAKDPESWRRWGNADPWDQAVAVRAIANALATIRPSLGLSAAILTIARTESGFNPWAKNPKSTACGIFQFIRATWTPYGGDHGYCLDPGMNATAGVKHLTTIFIRNVKRAMPPLEELPDDQQRAEFIFRGLYAFHYHGLASTDAMAGGLVDSQLPAENNIQHVRNFLTVLRRATYVPRPGRKPPARAGRPAPKRSTPRSNRLLRAS